MKDEFDKEIFKSDTLADEIEQYKEVKTYKEASKAEEIKEVKELGRTNKVKKKKNQSSFITRLSTFFVGIVAAGTLVVSSATAPKVTVQFDDAVVTDTTVTYGVSVNTDSEITLYIVLSNDFVSRKEEITDDYMTNTITDLAPNMEYDLSVVTDGTFNDTVIAKMTVKTLSEEDYKIAKFNDVESRCDCNIDGYFYFTMDYIDNIDSYANFEAYLEDEEGNRSYCEFNDDPHSEQCIVVTDSLLVGNSAYLTIYCDVMVSGNVERTMIYRALVAI